MFLCREAVNILHIHRVTVDVTLSNGEDEAETNKNECIFVVAQDLRRKKPSETGVG